MKVAKSVEELIGKTPLLRLNGLSDANGAEIYGKCEFMNPNGSVKDRIGANLINTAIKSGKITKDTVIIEPTSGNTGIALASICAVKGLRLILTMPSSMSIERQKLLKAYGAEIVLTPAERGMRGAVETADALAAEYKNSFIPGQFDNDANPDAHRHSTALELIEDTGGKIDIFVAAIGTGGTITGVGEILRAKIQGIKIIAVEPKDSPVLSGGTPGPHKIQGIGAGFVPSVLNKGVFDEIITVSNEDAFAAARGIARSEGVLVGISAGANAHAASIIAARPENKGKTIVTVLCDTGERYLSTPLFDF
ncbi:MAG TPA: cysteine synthase A [Campylobacterales bacterium]|nr:cysteine synthase A [Campylobacterales bacterium]